MGVGVGGMWGLTRSETTRAGLGRVCARVKTRADAGRVQMVERVGSVYHGRELGCALTRAEAGAEPNGRIHKGMKRRFGRGKHVDGEGDSAGGEIHGLWRENMHGYAVCRRGWHWHHIHELRAGSQQPHEQGTISTKAGLPSKLQAVPSMRCSSTKSDFLKPRCF